MGLDRLPPNIEQGVQSYADALHITHDEAVLRILETGLKAVSPRVDKTPAEEIAEERRRRDVQRQLRLKTLAENPPARAEAVIGAFADTPGFRDAIDGVISRRAHRYGFDE